MSEQEEKQMPVCEKQGMIAGIPFRPVDKEPRSLWRTGYNYYLAQKAKGGALKPYIARFYKEEGSPKEQFQIYMDGEWQNADFWEWSEPIMEDGKVVTNKAGKPKRRPFFRQFFEYHLKFDNPVEIEYFDKELKQSVTEELDEFYVRFSENVKKKIEKEINDDRNPDDAKFKLNYDPSKTPAEQYEVVFVKE